MLVSCSQYNIYSTVNTVDEPKPFTLIKSIAKLARGITNDQSGKLYITEAETRILRINADGSDEVNLVPGLAGECMIY